MAKEFITSRTDFERNFSILSELLIAKKIHFTIGSTKSMDGLEKVRMLPNRRFDFNTVNESARLMANTASQFEHMHKNNGNEES